MHLQLSIYFKFFYTSFNYFIYKQIVYILYIHYNHLITLYSLKVHKHAKYVSVNEFVDSQWYIDI